VFRFNDNVRPQVERIVSVMQWANDNQYASQRDVFGMMEKALCLIVSRECGDDVLDTIEHSRHHWNFGGNESWLVDVEVAVEHAKQEIADSRIQTTVDVMQALSEHRKQPTTADTIERDSQLRNLLLAGIDHTDLVPAQRSTRGHIRNLCCGMTDAEMIEYYTQERNAGRNFNADCVLEFFAV
jgi:hypothetical protein